MDKISINLIPIQLETLKKEQTRKKILNRASIFLLVIMIGISSLVLSFEIFLRLSLSKTEQDLQNIKNQIADLKDQETLNFILKDRLASVLLIINKDSSQSQAYNLITTLMPNDVNLLAFSVKKNGQVSLSGDTNSVSALNIFFNNLTDPASNEGRVVDTKVENLNQSQSGHISFDLLISLSSEQNKKASKT